MNNSFFCLVVIFTFHLYFLFCVSQDLSGYISIDCGSVKGSSYKGLEYSTDAGFIDSGENHVIQAAIYADMDDQMMNLRSFPVGKRNCYNLSVAGAGAGAAVRKGNTYLIRAHFLYGNYDGKNVVSQFDLYLGVEYWATINTDKYLWLEIIKVPSSDYVYVCLVNTGKGIPYISALELRPIKAKGYTIDPKVSWQYVLRSYFGSSNQIIRYEDDIYDRRWSPFPTDTSWKELNTTTKVGYDSNNLLLPPSIVLQSAVTPKDNNSDLIVNFEGGSTKANFSFIFYFCEVEQHPQARLFHLYLNDDTVHSNNVILSRFLSVSNAYIEGRSSGNQYTITLRKDAGSPYPPLLNAMEMYNVTHFFQSQTYENDVFAAVNIKATYGLNKPTWQGDPCLPQNYSWEGLDCVTFDNQSTPPRIKYLDLSSSGLSGLITPYLSGLESLEFLDLSNNMLSGPIPDFLAELPSLKVLNISGNNFDGPVPLNLTNKANAGSLLFRFNNTHVTKKKVVRHKPFVKILALSLVALLLCLAIALFVLYRKRIINADGGVLLFFTKQKDVDTGDKSERFSMAEIRHMTKKFKNPIGKGGFGQVFRGTMTDGTEVAVKLLSSESSQGHHQLEAEVKLLKRASHQNLTPILGYCDDGKEMAIVYKYMPNGSLNTYLCTDSKKVLTWRQRLSIAFGATQGLHYLHECNFIHRDVKPENILLDEKLEAKLGDYGLVREFKENSTHATTALQGTHGYVDPEYGINYQLREKSDVYSMGVVLLRLITGQPIGVHVGNEDKHITHWLKDVDVNDDKQLKAIVDPKLEGNFDMESVKKAFTLATKCASPKSDSRPNMSEAVKELEECLKLARGQ